MGAGEGLVAPEDGCLPGEVAVEEGCAQRTPVEVRLSERKTVTLTPLLLGRRGAWLGDRSGSAAEAARACEAVGLPAYLPTDREELAAGVGAAALASIGGEVDSVWTALQLDLVQSVAVGPDGAVAFAWRPGAVPMSGRPGLGQEVRAQADVEAVAAGQPTTEAPHCFALRADGALVVDRCEGARKALFCLDAAR